jgi:hypothetical protein
MKAVSQSAFCIVTGLAAFGMMSILGAPGLFWGESALITARAWILGGSHPPGYPGFMQIIRLFQGLIPLGDVAFRANLSGWIILGVFTALLCRLFLSWNLNTAVSMIASLGFSLALPVFKATAAVEVYSLHLLMIILIILLNTSPDKAHYSLYATVFTASLALTHHLTFVLFIPGLIVWMGVDKRKDLKQTHIVPAIIFALLGMSLYLYLPLRDHVNPGYVWGNPSSRHGFIQLVTASEEARGAFRSGLSQWAPIQVRGMTIFQTLVDILAIPGLLLVVPGFIGLYRRSRGLFLFFILSLSALTVSVLIYDSHETISFFLPGILLIWMLSFLGLGELTYIISTKGMIQNRLLQLLYLLIPVALLVSNLLQILPIRLTDVHAPRGLVRKSLDTIPNESVIISQRSDWCFLHWYLSDIENYSHTVTVFQPLLSFYWYYSDLVKESAMTGSLKEHDFEDSRSWNAAATASLVARNSSRKQIRLVEPQVVDDVTSGGFGTDDWDCTLFGAEIGWKSKHTHLYLASPFTLTGRVDPISSHAIGALYYHYGVCLEKIGRHDESQTAFNQAVRCRNDGY